MGARNRADLLESTAVEIVAGERIGFALCLALGAEHGPNLRLAVQQFAADYAKLGSRQKATARMLV
jgi:hypothetical protein